MATHRALTSFALAALILTSTFGCGDGGDTGTPPPLTVEISLSFSGSEGNTGATGFDIMVNLSSAATADVTVTYDTTDGTATAGVDYTAVVAGSLTIPAGSSVGTVSVDVLGDTMHEPNETLVVTISAPVNATLGAQTGCTVTIENDDAQPTVSVPATFSQDEGDGTTTFGVPVALSNTSYQDITIQYDTSDGTATGGVDYTPVTAGSVVIPAGSTTAPANVEVNGDTTIEGNETFTVALSNPTNATLGAQTDGTVTILCDDAPTITVAATDPFARESGATGTFEVSQDKVAPVTVYYTVSGSATSGADFAPLSGSIALIGASATFDLSPFDDPDAEGHETVIVTITTDAGYIVGATDEATVWLLDDDTYFDASAAITGGSSFTIALRNDGTVWSWGTNANEQLGDGTPTDRHMPVQVVGAGGTGVLSRISNIACGYSHSVSLRADGTVWAWGANGDGQLGDTTATDSATPVQVVGNGGTGVLAGITSIAGGSAHTIALMDNGTVWSWGLNTDGQLGDGTFTQSGSPVQVVGIDGSGLLTDVTAIASGSGHGVSLSVNGTVSAWGANAFGQLGDDSTSTSETPVLVVGPGGTGTLTGITAVASGDTHTLALRDDGTVWAWGNNAAGQLGDGTAVADSSYPVQVVGAGGSGTLTTIIGIACGGTHSLALAVDGTVWAWGGNTTGQLGDGTTSPSSFPVQVVGPGGTGLLTDVIAIGAGASHSVCRRADSTAWSWGSNATGELGDGLTTDHHTPIYVRFPGRLSQYNGVCAISCGAENTMAVKEGGTLWAWGSNDGGQLADEDGYYVHYSTPTQMPGPGGVGFMTDVVSVKVGGDTMMALRSDGTLWGLGANMMGQLGISITTDQFDFVQVLGPGGTGFLTGVADVTCGWEHTVAVTDDGSVFAWGSNYNGQLGDGTTTERHTPTQVLGPGGTGFLNDAVAVAAGSAHVAALLDDGTVWTWGSNTYGQLGDNTTIERHTPVQVLGPGGVGFLSGITAIAGQLNTVVALRDDGTVWMWGRNTHGQLGNGTTANAYVPVQVLGPGGTGFLTGVTSVDVSGHTVALRDDGTVWTWGYSSYGQLGDKTLTQRTTPVQVVASNGVGFLSNVLAIAAGSKHTAALLPDGSILTWGGNSQGQLGNGSEASRALPDHVVQPGTSVEFSGMRVVDAGLLATSALGTDGSIWSWGLNTSSQLGDGTTTQRLAPVQVNAPLAQGFFSGARQIAYGASHGLALKVDGTVWAWGNNASGQLGDGTSTTRSSPVQVLDSGGIGVLDGIVDVACYNHSAALRDDGTVWTWGDNSYGMLGDGTTTQRSTPVQVVGPGGSGYLTSITNIACDSTCTIALRSDGTVWAWGDNLQGQLGDNTQTPSETPVQVVGLGGTGFLTGITGIASGEEYTLATAANGTVWGWGKNTFGRLGDGTFIRRLSPVQTLGLGGAGLLTGITSVACGGNHSASLSSDGTVWTFGGNDEGQLGDGSFVLDYRNTPAQVVGPGGSGILGDVSALSAGYEHTMFVKADGTVWGCGSSMFGALGNNDVASEPSPVQAGE